MIERDLDRICTDYLSALHEGDLEALDRLWVLAGANPDLEAAFHELNAELQRLEDARAAEAVAAAVRTHLPAAEIVAPRSGPVTLGEAAEHLFRHPPVQMPAEAHTLNDALRTASTAIPTDLNLPKFVAWLEPLYGAAPKAYWKALYEAALQLDLQRSSAEYQLAARPAPGGPK